jgi:poly(A) polymerase
VHVVGSARLGVANTDSDLDLVCAGPASQDRFAVLAALQERLASDGVSTGGREVAGAGLALLRCRIGDIAVDLQYAGLPPSLQAHGLAGLDAAALATLDEGSRRAALGCADADALMRLATERVEVAVFQALLRQVRAWARARQLDAGAWGLLGGYTWALLAGFAAREAGPEEAGDPALLLRRFFTLFTAWEPGRPVAFGPVPSAASSRRAPWPIYTPTPPSFNSARSLTRSTHELLRGELARAAALLGAGADLTTLCAACEAPGRRIVVALRAEDPADLTTAAGWLEGQVLGLLLALERHGARVRPYPRAVRVAGGRDYAIGVEGGGGALLSAAQDFVAEFAGWIGRPPGASFTASLVQR